MEKYTNLQDTSNISEIQIVAIAQYGSLERLLSAI